MELHPLPPDDGALYRLAEELWVPYNRYLEDVIPGFSLAEQVDLSNEVEFRRDALASEEYRAWVAVDGVDDQATVNLATDGTFAGFVMTNVDACPPIFDRPDRLMIGDLYVIEPYRGTGLGRTLIGRARERAREVGCDELLLEVDVGNENAVGFYEALGFEPLRRTLTLGVEEL